MSLRVITVCTANVCRSPMAAALLRHHAAQLGVDAIVGSAGTQVFDLPVDPLAVGVLAEQGLDISQHQPRRLDRALLEAEGAHLVLAMTRDHLRTAATTAPGSLRRTFTLREFVRRAALVEPMAGEGLHQWLDEVAKSRSARDLMGDDPADDIADPYGATLAVHRQCSAEIDQLAEVVARTLATLAGTDVSGPA